MNKSDKVNLENADSELVKQLSTIAEVILDIAERQHQVRQGYLRLRAPFEPDNKSVIFILESPPASGKYFYDTSGLVTEPLFKAMMDFMGVAPTKKEEGLTEFKKRGYLIVDVSYVPVNREENKEKRNSDLLLQEPFFLRDMERVNPTKEIPLVLVKANICRLFENTLKEKGYIVKNQATVIPFPSSGQQGNFRAAIKNVMTRTEFSNV